MSETSASKTDHKIDCCAVLERWVTLLLSKNPRKGMIISDLGLQITETFDKSIKRLTGMTTTAFFDRMKKKKVIDIESDSGKYGSFNVVVLRNNEIIKEIESDSSSAEDANSDNADSEHLKPSKKRKISDQSDQPTKKRKLNDSEMAEDDNKQRHKGIVKLFLSSKGYGFIKWNGDDKDLWFHANDSQNENERAPFISGDAVEFEIITNRGKDTAINVVLDPDRVIPKFRGKCIQWNEDKRFGFLQMDDGGDDVFVHQRNLIDEDSLREGDRAEFEVITDYKTGKFRAVRVRKIEEENDDDSENAESAEAVEDDIEDDQMEYTKERYKGVVKLFSKSKGYGFIKWSEGKELWFHANDSQKLNERVTFITGDVVEFEIGTNRGHLAAINVVLDPDHETPKIRGQCMRWNEEKGFGFIKRDDDGADVFVHCDSLIDESTLRAGDRVEFVVIEHHKTGKSRAVRVRKIEEENEDSADSVNKMNLNAKDEASDSSEITTKERHKGEIGLFLNNKGYGFIKWDGGEDLWFHIDDSWKENEPKPQFYTGEAVFFEIGIGRKGDDVAVNVVLDPDRELQRSTGKCISWNEYKGFGFIQTDDGEENVFVYSKGILDGVAFDEGERLQFELITNQKSGKLQAVRVEAEDKDSEELAINPFL